MKLREYLRNRIRIFNKHILNPLTLRLARPPFNVFAIIQHTGRRSGRAYETPLIVRPAPDGFMIALTYGPNVDWYKNVQAAGGCTVVWHGQAYPVSGTEPVDAEAGRSAFLPWQRLVMGVIGMQHFAKLRSAQAPMPG